MLKSYRFIMISFRYPYYALCAGSLVLAVVFLLPIWDWAEVPTLVLGLLLALDGALGLRVLPALIPYASTAEDWEAIERHLYLGRPGWIRAFMSALTCLSLVPIGLKGGVDWAGISLVFAIVAFGIGWAFAARAAIRAGLTDVR